MSVDAQDLSKPFISRLQAALQTIHLESETQTPSPPSSLRRASVALVIRIRSIFPQEASYDLNTLSTTSHTFQESFDKFFSQNWVQQGDPEVLFIKRAKRNGDRWSSHISFPGGKRELNDQSDRITAERETREETGLELDVDYCLYIGTLPERNYKNGLGQCPMRHDIPPLALQPSEVHSAHWTPLTGLLSPSLRTDVRCDILERFSRQRIPSLRLLLRAIAGQLVFAAVKLQPTESLRNSTMPASIAQDQQQTSPSVFMARWLNVESTDEGDQPLILWGLTLGIVADLLEMIDRPATAKLWSWPTFSPWDLRLTIWLLNHRFQSRKIRELTNPVTNAESKEKVQVRGLDTTTYTTSVSARGKGSEAGINGMMLFASYTVRLRKAVVVALFLRLGFGTAILIFVSHKYRRYNIKKGLEALSTFGK